VSTHVELPHILPWSTFAACWLVLGVLVVAAHGLVRPRLLGLDAAHRSALVFRLALLPLITAAAVTFLTFAPGIGGIMADGHCLRGAQCLRHIPVFCASLTHALLLVAGSIMLSAAPLWMLCARLRDSFSFNRALSRIADLHPDQPIPAADPTRGTKPAARFKVIETRRLFAYCAGFLRGRVIVSRGLVDVLTPAELDAVVAHEQAHAERYDNTRRLLALVGLWLVPQRWSRGLLQDLALASEAVCDRWAARRTGNVQSVVDAVRKVMRLNGPMAESLGAAFVDPRTGSSPGDDLRHRIAELLDEPGDPRFAGLLLTIGTLLVYVYAIVGLTEAVHHLIDHWIA
jgi:Zn-dependent protease with chaperone function